MAETLAEAKIVIGADGSKAAKSIDDVKQSLRELSRTPTEAKIAGIHKQFRDLTVSAKSLYTDGKIGFDEYRRFVDDVASKRGAAVKKIIDEESVKKANSELQETNKQLAKIKAIAAAGAFKGVVSQVLGDGAGQILDATTSGMVMFGAAGAAVGAALGIVATASESASQRVAELNAEFRRSLADAADARKSFEALGEAYRAVRAGGGTEAAGKVASIFAADLEKARTRTDELRASLNELKNTQELQSGLEKAGKSFLGFVGIGDRDIAEKIDEASDALLAQERVVATLSAKYEAAKQARAQSQLADVKQSLFSLGLNDAERGIASVAAQYDDLLKKARMLNVSEDERAAIMADINQQRDEAIAKAEKEARAQDSIAGKIMGVEQFARTMQERALAAPKAQIRQDVLDRIKAGPQVPALEADRATEENTDATKSLTTSVEALRRGIEVAKGVRIGPGE